ncbi:MAG: sigma-70 family RNA polymerase sigma factor [Kiloniellales bacterium]|nr:sigma-70 family RNA polymerase sigma factor [Kiloniellales bacterium]
MARALTLNPMTPLIPLAMDDLGLDDLGLDGLDGLIGSLERRAPKRRRAKAAPGRNGAAAAAGPAEKNAAKNAAKNAEKNADDLALVRALSAGGSGAWADFVARFSGVVFAAVQRRLIPAGRAEEVEDVVQEVFVRLCKADYRLLKSYDPARARLSTWLTVVATSAAIDHLRRRKMAQVAIDDAPESSLAVEDPAFEKIKIPEGLLSARQALVLELLYTRDLEVADAAEIMQVDPQTVRSTHHKALTKLRAHFRAIGELPA